MASVRTLHRPGVETATRSQVKGFIEVAAAEVCDEVIGWAIARKEAAVEERKEMIKEKLRKLAVDSSFESIRAMMVAIGEFPAERAGKRTGPNPDLQARYRNPENPDETWSGRGRMPKWLAAKMKVDGFDPDKPEDTSPQQKEAVLSRYRIKEAAE